MDAESLQKGMELLEKINMIEHELQNLKYCDPSGYNTRLFIDCSGAVRVPHCIKNKVVKIVIKALDAELEVLNKEFSKL
jgi:hypothetical protein